MALNIIKKIKQVNKLENEIEALLELCDEKKILLRRAVQRANFFENELHKAHEENVMLKGQLKHQNMVMEYLHKQNTDLLLASRAKPVTPPTIRVLEVRTDVKAENSNS